MKIALISDIHSNYNALQKVIIEINQLECDTKICLGDMVGYYDRPNEVIDCLRENSYICIKGNHEKFILGEINYKKENEKIYGIDRHKRILSYENYLFIKECPEFIEFEYDGKKYCFCHSLKNNTEYYLRDIEAVMNKIDVIKEYDYYFYGHTHRKNSININNRILLNPGSIGQQRDNDWRPSFCIIDLDNNTYDIRNVDYDIKKYIKDLINKSFDKILIDVLMRNIE